MPLQNRASPFGVLLSDPARGTLMGNRGGRIHRDDRTLGTRLWASPQWICCALDFRGRRRAVWGASYTELFFLDEVTALAAGHRPCFECRRRDAVAFAAAWAKAAGAGTPPRAAAMDRALHAERLDRGRKRLHRASLGSLPEGAMIAQDGAAFALRDGRLLRWSVSGYRGAAPGPKMSGDVTVLTPPSILGVLSAGYRPLWHPDAGSQTSRP